MDRLEPGARIGDRYIIERALAEGGMGSVFVALDEKMGDRIALKIGGGVGAAHRFCQDRFKREARICNKLGRTEGFVRAFDWGDLNDGVRLYLAMDLVEDAKPLDLETGSLTERLARVRQAAVLVARAHEQGVIHRDIKPANFLQAPDGTLWLADFGLGKVLGQAEAEDEDPNLTQTGVAMGTLPYMPPEQFDDAKRVDKRADVYALGVMLFRTLTGKAPYTALSLFPLVAKHQRVLSGKDAAPAPRDTNPEVPEDLNALCMLALALDPDERLESAQRLVELLDEPSSAPTLIASMLATRQQAAETAATLPPPTTSTLKDATFDPLTAPTITEAPAPPETPRSPVRWVVAASLATVLALGLGKLGLDAVGAGSAVSPSGATKGEPRDLPLDPTQQANQALDPTQQANQGLAAQQTAQVAMDQEQQAAPKAPRLPPGVLLQETFEGPELGPAFEVVRRDDERFAFEGGRLKIRTHNYTQPEVRWRPIGFRTKPVGRELFRARNVVRSRAPISAPSYQVTLDATIHVQHPNQVTGLLLIDDDENFACLTIEGDEYGNNRKTLLRLATVVDAKGTVDGDNQKSHQLTVGRIEDPEDVKLELSKRGGMFVGRAKLDHGSSSDRTYGWVKLELPVPESFGPLRVGLIALNGDSEHHYTQTVEPMETQFDTLTVKKVVEGKKKTKKH